jgi:hypothetical protein
MTCPEEVSIIYTPDIVCVPLTYGTFILQDFAPSYVLVLYDADVLLNCLVSDLLSDSLLHLFKSNRDITCLVDLIHVGNV